MTSEIVSKYYDFTGRNVVVTGGGGVLCSEMALAVAGCGAKVAVLDRDLALAQKVVDRITQAGGTAIPVQCDVLSPERMEEAKKQVTDQLGFADTLINGAGGNNPKATTNPSQPFFSLPPEALRFVFDLNIIGTILPSQVFGRAMAEHKSGVILNVSSMNSFRPLTRIAAYSAAKAGVSNFTQWLAVHMAQEYSPEIRVNAVAPGFFLTEQNRFLMTEQATGALTERGKKVIDHTPMARFGTPQDLLGAVLWLLSPAASFVTGTIVPIDGGFSAYSGV
jgi:NAD(P)-dependent dehydrogenase (short-subunit alcohol dehydrogenase family)